MPLTLYYLETSSPARSVDLVIRALDLSPQYKTVNIFENEHLEAKFLKVINQKLIKFELYYSGSILIL